MKVKIRQEESDYLVYFIDSRRVVSVNEVGSVILDALFNQGKCVREISELVVKDYGVSPRRAHSDIIIFLNQIKEEVHPDGFNVIEQRQLVAPLGIELEITTSCNLRCRHCFQGEHGEVFMPTERAMEIIGMVADGGVCEVSIIGGEPMRHKGIVRILQYCQSRNLAINLVTNATLISDKVVDELSDIRRLVVIVSLDGIGETHDAIRGKGVFKRIEPILKNLQAKGVAVETICTLNAVNVSSYMQVVEYCEGNGIPCNFNLFKPFQPDHDNLILKPDDFFEVITNLLRLRRDKGYKIGLSNAAVVTELLGLPERNECRATKSGMVIDVHGRMITCPSLVAAGYYNEGDLPYFGADSLEKWKNHEAFVRFRENGTRECQARSFIFSGDVRGYDPYGITAFREYRQRKEV